MEQKDIKDKAIHTPTKERKNHLHSFDRSKHM